MGNNIRQWFDMKEPTYRDFIYNNRKNNSKTLNMVLWTCVLVGPLLALGAWSGIFESVSYDSCLWVSILTAGFAFTHMLMVKFDPASVLTGFWPLFVIDILIVYMESANMRIGLAHFFVPLLALLYCETTFFVIVSVVNYLSIVYSALNISAYNAALRVDGMSAKGWFLETVGGYTIETLVMSVGGYLICHTIVKYIKTLYENRQQISSHMMVITSMAEIYDEINLIDYNRKIISHVASEDGSQDSVEYFHIGSGYISTANRVLLEEISKEQRETFIEFTNIDTVKERLDKKRSIFKEFKSAERGWFRAQFIRVGADDEECQNVIFTIEDIDDEKRREEQLIKISKTDELTKLYNRRAYEEDISEYRKHMTDDFMVIMIDVNGLKMTNDTLGHEAGDELICGVASVLNAAFAGAGRVYRVGGDEFAVILETKEPYTDIRARLKTMEGDWHGEMVKELYLSVGYAKHSENPEATLEDLEKLADSMMYQEKNAYYREKGIDRRGQRTR